MTITMPTRAEPAIPQRSEAARPAGANEATFNDHLAGIVDRYMGDLTAAHAVDEANGDVLDLLLDQAVAQQQNAIERDILKRTAALRQQLQKASSQAEAVETALEASRSAETAHGDRIRDLRHRLDGTDAPPAAGGAPVNPALMRVFVEQERAHWKGVLAGALRSVRLRNHAGLPAAAASASRAADAASERMASAQARSVAAESELADALARLRGRALTTDTTTTGGIAR